MKLFDRNGVAVDVPDENVKDALSSGQLGLPAGTKVPVRLEDGRIGTVPIEGAREAFAKGATTIGAEEHRKAELQARYGDVGHQVAAGLEGAASMASLGATDYAAVGAGSLFGGQEGSEAVRRHLQENAEANPISHGIGVAGGLIAPALLTGGASTAVEGAEGVGALARAGEAASAVGKAIAAPSELTMGLGNLVERGVGKLVGEEATTLAGRVAQKAAKLGARGVVEGGVFGGAQAADESMLGDTELTGQKLLGAVGNGMLFGGLGGAGLGAAGKLGSEILGRAASGVSHIAERQMFKALDPLTGGVKLAERVEGGAEAIGRQLLDDKVAAVGDTVEDLANKIKIKRAEAGDRIGSLLENLDATAGAERPKVLNIVQAIEKNALPDLERLPSLNRGSIAKIRALSDDILSAAGVPTHEAAIAAGMSEAEYEAMLAKATLSYKDLQRLRVDVQNQINYGTQFGKPVDAATEAMKAVRSAMEGEIEAAGDKASKTMGGDFLKEYRDAKGVYQRYKAADQIAERGVQSRNARRTLSPSDNAAAGVGALGAVIAGHPVTGALYGLGSGIAHHIVRERGNVLAAIAADKLGAIGGAQRAAALVDREVERGVAHIAGKTERVPPRLKESGAGPTTFNARRTQVQQAAADVETHASSIQQAASPLAQHAPQTANAFQRAAIRATAYLARALPPAPPPSLIHNSKADTFEASDTDQAQFMDKWDALHDPPGVLAHVHAGTVTPSEIDALQAVHPEWLAEMRSSLKRELMTTKAEIPYERQVAISLFLGEPTSPTLTPEMVSLFQGAYPAGPSATVGQGKAKGGGKGKSGAPKRKIHVPGGVGLQGLNKELGV